MKTERKNTASSKIGRRGMLKSVLAGTATMSFGRLAAADYLNYKSIDPGTIANSTWCPAKLKVNPNGPLRMQPVLVYEIPKRKEKASWRTWSGLITEEHAEEERTRIRTELEALKSRADFQMEILPLISVQTVNEAESLYSRNHDGLIVYANGGPVYNTAPYQALIDPGKMNLVFVRHQSGPVYYYYCGVQHRLLRQGTDEFNGIGNLRVEDVVVDDYDEVLWRLRAFNGLKRLKGKRIVCIGGPWGHSEGMSVAPDNARSLWDMDLVDVSYGVVNQKIDAAFQDKALVSRCTAEAQEYLNTPGVELFPMQENLTTRELFAGKGSRQTLSKMNSFMERTFVLKEVFVDLMKEFDTDAITVQGCMGTIMDRSETTACMVLTMLNDEGYLAFCESDFVVIPASILLHYISGKPVFFGNPTFPHKNRVTVAHCSSPRKMDGINLEPVKIRTHFESDYGVAPKVEMRVGQNMTVIIPDFNSRRWAGFEGTVLDNPELDICTTQLDIGFKGNAGLMAREIRGFHWPMCYGDYMREMGYALSKTPVEWLNLNELI